MVGSEENIKGMAEIWKDRKRTLFGLPLSFTKYVLHDDKLLISTGLFNTREDEVRLYRIKDLSLSISLGQRLFGIGTIQCCSSDKTLGNFEIKNIKNPKKIKETLSSMIEKERKENRVGTRELLGDSDDFEE